MKIWQMAILVGMLAVVRIALTIRGGRSTLRDLLDSFIGAGAVALVIVTFVGRTYFIPSESMVPTLQVHDVLVADELSYRFGSPHDGQVAIFTPPIPADDAFIKRVIGMPGDRIRVHDGVVERNGESLDEPYIAEKPQYELEVRDYGIYVDGIRLSTDQANIPPRAQWTSPETIPPGCYLMLGDNRNDSEDSHIWGFAQRGGTFATGVLAGHRAGFTAHALAVLWPLPRAGALR